MRNSEILVIMFIILISILASTSLGFLLGSQSSPNFQKAIVALNQTTTISVTVTPASDQQFSNSSSIPIEPDPFEFSEVIGPGVTTWYVPIVFVGAGVGSELFVNYNCSGFCPSNNSSVASLGLQDIVPRAFSLASNGTVVPTEDLLFSSPEVLDVENSSETLLYRISVSSSSSGYYSFNLPYGCSIEPILFVKTGSSGFDSSLVQRWLGRVGRQGTGCSDDVQVTILGFTNSYYTEVPLTLPTS